MPRCYMVKKQSNKYPSWGPQPEGPDSPTEACVAPSYYTSNGFIPDSESRQDRGVGVEENATDICSPFRARSIEETEAAHDLLSLSQSLPPLTAPGVVTIHQTVPSEDGSYRPFSPTLSYRSSSPPTTRTRTTAAATAASTTNPPQNCQSPPITYEKQERTREIQVEEQETEEQQQTISYRNISPIPVQIPYYHQNNVVYLLQVPPPQSPTPPTSDSSTNGEQEHHHHRTLDAFTGEDIIILPLSPEESKTTHHHHQEIQIIEQQNIVQVQEAEGEEEEEEEDIEIDVVTQHEQESSNEVFQNQETRKVINIVNSKKSSTASSLPSLSASSVCNNPNPRKRNVRPFTKGSSSGCKRSNEGTSSTNCSKRLRSSKHAFTNLNAGVVDVDFHVQEVQHQQEQEHGQEQEEEEMRYHEMRPYQASPEPHGLELRAQEIELRRLQEMRLQVIHSQHHHQHQQQPAVVFQRELNVGGSEEEVRSIESPLDLRPRIHELRPVVEVYNDDYNPNPNQYSVQQELQHQHQHQHEHQQQHDEEVKLPAMKDLEFRQQDLLTAQTQTQQQIQLQQNEHQQIQHSTHLVPLKVLHQHHKSVIVSPVISKSVDASAALTVLRSSNNVDVVDQVEQDHQHLQIHHESHEHVIAASSVVSSSSLSPSAGNAHIVSGVVGLRSAGGCGGKVSAVGSCSGGGSGEDISRINRSDVGGAGAGGSIVVGVEELQIQAHDKTSSNSNSTNKKIIATSAKNIPDKRKRVPKKKPTKAQKHRKSLKTKFYIVEDEEEEPPSSDEAPESPTTKNKYKCNECGKQYATSSNLSRHKQTHRSLDSQSAKKCTVCGKAYVSMPALAMHVLTHKLAHHCGVCGKQFSRPWLLQGHLRSHTGEKPYGCAHCGKAFADRSNLRAHMQTHSTDKNYRCQNCKKTFALKSYLNKHQESSCQAFDPKKSSDKLNDENERPKMASTQTDS